MTGAVGIAVLGCGHWGINYVRVFNEVPQARVVAVCDPRADRLAEVARRFPGAGLTTRAEDALRMDGVDAAVVCTEASAHHRLARQALAAGKPVLVEKPLTISVSDAEDLIDLSESRRLTLMVGHTFIYNSGVRKVKEVMGQIGVGRLYYLYARRTNLGPIRRDVNALWDLAPHDVSIFNHLLGGVPEWASAVGAKVLRNGREDVGFVSLGYAGGIVGHIHVSWSDPHKVREVVVVGSDRRIVFDDLNPLEQVRIFERGVAASERGASNVNEDQVLMRDGDIVSPRVDASEPLKNQCLHFLDCVGGGGSPLTGGREGRDVVRVMKAIDRSLARQGAPVRMTERGDGYGHAEPELAGAFG